jgi:hypothetical protein
MPTNTYVALDKKTVTGSAVANIEFTGISSGYTDLVIVASIYGTTNDVGVYAQFNGDTTSSYSDTLMLGTGSAAQSARYSSGTYAHIVGYNAGISSTTGVFCPAIINLQNYSNTSTYKTILTRGFSQNNSNNGDVSAIVSLWRKTEAISSVKIFLSGGNIAVGSTFSLYGIAADTNAFTAKATGGTITADVGYIYHTFTSTGTFTPLQSLSCDYLVIAGGGGGGSGGGGGGGAGGFRAITNQSLTATAYTVTVGGGGAQNTKGENSVFNSLSATGGGQGGSGNTNGSTGGSGGGSGIAQGTARSGGAGNQGSYSPVEGYTGGSTTPNDIPGLPAGGGGGAGAVGTNAAYIKGGNGGSGLNTYSSWATVTSTGVSGFYAGGGGGVCYFGNNDGEAGSGGAGGGGQGGHENRNSGVAGTANTGGGGGGARTGTGGNGGSGIVIIRYAK